DQEPEGPVAQRLAAAIDPARHHRDAAGHCLEQHEAESLAMAWHHVRVRKPVVVGLLGLLHVAGEDDAALQPHIFRFSLEARPVAAVANDNVREFGYYPEKLRHQLDHLVEAFIPLGGYDPPDGHQHLAS